MDSNAPLITVYIPTYNRCNMLKRALKSILNQTYKNLEIIVVDDGSTDNTQEFMQKYVSQHPNVKYFRHDNPRGANAARNYALREARGVYVTGLDDDDEMLPECIEKMLKAYDEKYAYVFAGSNTVTREGSQIRYSEKKIITLQDMLYSNLTGNQVFSTKEMFINAGMFDENLVSAQDYDMWIRLLKLKQKAKAVQEPLYNVHDMTHKRITSSPKQIKGYLQCYFKHRNIMNRYQRGERLAYLRKIQGKNLTPKEIKVLFPKKRWLRLYFGYYKRQILNF